MANNEKIINVPLKKRIKEALEEMADDNGRATGREAARIIEEQVKKAGYC